MLNLKFNIKMLILNLPFLTVIMIFNYNNNNNNKHHLHFLTQLKQKMMMNNNMLLVQFVMKIYITMMYILLNVATLSIIDVLINGFSNNVVVLYVELI